MYGEINWKATADRTEITAKLLGYSVKDDPQYPIGLVISPDGDGICHSDSLRNGYVRQDIEKRYGIKVLAVFNWT